MTSPTEIQFKQLERLVGNLEMSIPVYCRRHDDGSVQVDAGNPYVIDDGDQLDSLLNDIMDINTDVEPDELFDEFVGIVAGYCDF